ncbi:MAG: nucleotide exchange factor GrpE, partial [Myxococcota bacterium]
MASEGAPVSGKVEPLATAEAAAEPAFEERLAALEAEKKETWDRLLRTAADLDNFRKRARRDVTEAVERGREEVLREVLPVADNLERALAHAGEADGPLLEGVRMVQRQLLQALERFDIRPYDSVGLAFDPERHEALSQEETDATPPGTIVREFQRGYRHGARVVRPAMVVVARAAAPQAADSDTPQPTGEPGDSTRDEGEPE